MANQNPLKATPLKCNQMKAHLTKLGRVLSGEYDGKGRKISKVHVGPSQPCATNGSDVFISYPIAPTMSDERLNLLYTEAVMAHECAGHLRYTNFNAWKRITDGVKRGDEDRLLHDFVNIVEDARVNYLLGQDFGGSKKRLDLAQDYMMAQHKKAVTGRVLADHEVPKMAVLAIATETILGVGHFFDNDKIRTMMDEVRPHISDAVASVDTSEAVKGARTLLEIYRTHFPEDECGGDEYGASKTPEAEGIFADDMDMDYITEAANSQKRNKQEAEKVQRKRFKKIAEKMPTSDSVEDADGDGAGEGESDADADADGQGDEGNEAGDGDAQGDNDGDSFAVDGEGQGEDIGDAESGSGSTGDGDGDGDDQGGDGDAQSASKENEALENLEKGEATVFGDNPDDGHMAGGEGSAEAQFGGTDFAENMLAEAADMLDDFEDMEFDDEGNLVENEYKWSDAYGKTEDHGHQIITQVNKAWREGLYPLEKYNSVASANKAGIKKLGREIERLIKGADSRFSTHHKRGKLDTRRLWAVKTSERLFQKPKEHEAFHLRCVVLIDASGSMSGNRARMAGQAAVTLCEALEQVGADYEVVDFNSSNGAVDGYEHGATYINVRKAANKALDTRAKRQVVTPYAGSQNSDGYAVKWAANRTKQIGKDGAKRLVFIISDGAPAGPAPSGMGAGDHLKHVLADLEHDDCLLFSVGICGMNTSRWYGNHGHASVGEVSTLAKDIIMPFKVAIKRLLNKGHRRPPTEVF